MVLVIICDKVPLSIPINKSVVREEIPVRPVASPLTATKSISTLGNVVVVWANAISNIVAPSAQVVAVVVEAIN